MTNLLKYTYLMEPKKVDSELNKAWERYQEILKNPSWEELNEARAILYSTGQIFCEQIAPEAIERRLHLLKKPISLIDFLAMIDGESKELKQRRQDALFKKLEDFYRAVKKFKNRFSEGKYYLDEERFIKLYNKYNPDKLKISYRGKFEVVKNVEIHKNIQKSNKK